MCLTWRPYWRLMLSVVASKEVAGSSHGSLEEQASAA